MNASPTRSDDMPTRLPRRVAKLPRHVAKHSRRVAELPRHVAKPSRRVARLPRHVAEPSRRVARLPRHVAKPSRRVAKRIGAGLKPAPTAWRSGCVRRNKAPISGGFVCLQDTNRLHVAAIPATCHRARQRKPGQQHRIGFGFGNGRRR